MPGRIVVALHVSYLYYHPMCSFFKCSWGILKQVPISHNYYESEVFTALSPQGGWKVSKADIQVIPLKLHLASLILHKTYSLGER